MRVTIAQRGAGAALRGPAFRQYRSIAAAALTALAAPSHATDYNAFASFDVRATHNDNLRMSENDKVSVMKYLAVPQVTLNANTETTQASLTSVLYFNRYSRSQYDSNDQNFGLSLSHKFETSTIGLDANLVRESTITSEELGSGVVGETAKRTERYVVSPSWSYFFNDSNMLQLQGNFTRQDYETEGYTPYKNIVGSLDWVHILTERMKLVLSGSYSKYESDDIDTLVPIFPIQVPVQRGPFIELVPLEAGYFGTQSYSSRSIERGGQIGIDYDWSEESQLQLRLGTSSSDTSYPHSEGKDICSNPDYLYTQQFGQLRPFLGNCEESTTERVSTAQVGWTWRNETQRLDLNGSKQTQPTANGYTVDATQIFGNWSYQLTELDQLSASLTIVRNRSVNESDGVRNSNIANRDYGSATLSYRRQFGEEWFVTGSYQYSRQKYTELDTDAHSQVMTLAISYQPHAWHWAR